MSKDVYQIPEASRQPQENTAAFSAEFDKTPYQRIKEIEENIFEYREAYLETQSSPHSSWLKGLVLSPSQQPQSLEALIENESHYGGTVFKTDSAFWLDVKSPYSDGFNPSVADWYHTQPNPGDPKEPVVLHFQTTPQSVHKLYKAHEYPMTSEEVSVLFSAITCYHDIITSLYRQHGIVTDKTKHAR